MNKADTAKIIATIQEVYPHFMDGRTTERTVDIWQKLFASEPYAVVSAAVVAFFTADTKGFPPNIGQIKEKIAQMTDEEPDEMQAWQMVKRALRMADRPRHTPAGEYAQLPAIVQQCIGPVSTFCEWAQADDDTIDVTTANAFMRTYRVRAQKQREYGKLPEFAKHSYSVLAEQDAYRLPAPKPEAEWDGEQTPVPDSVMQKVSVLRGMAQREELKRAADVSRRVDGLNVALDSLKRSNA